MITSEHIDLVSRFCESAYLNKICYPWVRKREPAAYANCVISDCCGPYWYKDFIGIEFIGELQFSYNTNEIIEITVVRLAGSKVHHGRTFQLQDITII